MRKMQSMPYVIGVKVRIFPSDRQKKIIDMNIGTQRFVYNKMIAYDKERFQLKKIKIYFDLAVQRIAYLDVLLSSVSAFQNANPFLYDDMIDAQAIANGIKNYHTAWSNYKKVPGTSIPVFHKKKASGSYQTNPHYVKTASVISDSNVHLDKDDHHITLPKLGSVHFKDSGILAGMFKRKCETRIGTITLSRDACGDYYASFQIGSVQPFKAHLESVENSEVGIDLNVKNFYTDSDGRAVDNPKFYTASEKKLAKQQRKLSRRAARAKKEGRSLSESANYQKQRLKVAKLQRHTARQREAFEHQASADLVKNHDMIAAENLNVKSLMKNHCLAKSIADCSWGEFLRQLEYKSQMYGRKFIKVPAAYTTQTCSVCGHVMKGKEKLTLDVREWTCPKCNTNHDRDHNSAVNILKKGLAVTQ